MVQRKRMNVAHLVGLLLVNEIYNKMPESNLRIFYREVEGAEDRHFIKIFKLRKQLEVSVKLQVTSKTRENLNN